MSVYFEKRLTTRFGDVSNDISWFEDKKLAVSFHSQGDGNYIGVYDANGNSVQKITAPGIKSHSPIGCIAWHPRGFLVAAWDSALCTSSDGETDVTVIDTPHRAPLILLLHSAHGGRMVSADSDGGVVGWSSSGRQLLTAFHHELSAPITHAVFRQPTNHGIDLRGAARAAVDGDERALDLFSNMNLFEWRPKTAGRRMHDYSSEYRDGMDFYAATSTGIILYVSESGRCEEVYDLGCACCVLLYRPDNDQLLVLTELLAVLQLSAEVEGGLREIMKVKLTGDTRELSPSMVWAGDGTVAVTSGGPSLRIWDLDTGDTSVLSLPATAPSAEHFTAIACSSSRVLCGGTNAGNLVLWSKSGQDWEVIGNTHVSTPVKQLAWGADVIVVSTLSNLFQLKQHPLSACFSQRAGCVQTAGNVVMVSMSGQKQELVTDMQIQGLSISSKYCILFSDKTAAVYILLVETKGELSIKSVGKFECECESAAIYDESLVILESERVTVRTIQGTVKQILFFIPTEGTPIVLELHAHFTSVVTSLGIAKIWDMSRREAKIHGRAKNLHEIINGYGEAMTICSNCDGSKIALTVASVDLVPENRIYVIDVETDNTQWLDIFYGNTEDSNPHEVKNLILVSFAWDEDEPKFLVVHAKSFDSLENILLCMWASQDGGILIHEKIELKLQLPKLLNCSAPLVSFLSPQSEERVEMITLGDFNGVSDVNPATKKSILNFSYNLAVGNMDLAFKAINSVNSESVWMNLARKCVRTKRLDVALVCMGRTGNARIAAAMRQAEREPELDARVAVLALNLGMLDEAEELLKGCGRFDLLNKLHQSLSRWDSAVQVAEHSDRVHLRATHHLRGKWLEQSGLIHAALQAYEQADTHRLHAPRLLVDDPDRLKAYVDSSGDVVLLKWFAQYVESVGDMQSALQYYTMAGDLYSSVRLLCFLGDWSKASEVVLTTGNRAAACHLARQLEAMEKIDEALIFFTKAGAFGNAIRICKEQGLTEKVWSLALQGSSRDQVDAAQFLLSAGETNKAILLFQRAGYPHKALELALQSGDTEALDLLATDLGQQLEPLALQRLAEALIDKQQYARAVDALLAAGKHLEAVSLCIDHSVLITEELAEKLCGSGPDRMQVLVQVANCALAQENYHLAAKKFTQAGNKINAMKALLKSGDTEKIVFLATISREKEVYVMAANYLQALDWRTDPQLLNTVIQFYTKAKAHNALANFYMACANVEVEDYDDLDKAVAALGEAKRSLSRLPEDGQSRRAIDTADRRINAIHQLQKARIAFQAGQTADGLNICQQILPICDTDGPIPQSKVLALMLNNDNDRSSARHLFEKLKTCVSDPTKLVSPSVLQSLGVLTATPSMDYSIDVV